MTNMMLTLKSNCNTNFTPYLALTNLLADLVMICELVYQTNSNYIFLFLILYLYFLNVRFNALTLLNYLDFLVL